MIMIEENENVLAPWEGAVPAAGLPALIRIPLPGNSRLAIAFRPGDRKLSESTSRLFIQDPTGKRHLRLDFGENPKTDGTVNYHWNQKGAFKDFGINNHTLAGDGGKILYQSARVFRNAGEFLVAFGLTIDFLSIVVASNPLRRSTEVVSAWALAVASAKVAGRIGAGIGTMIEPGPGTAVAGIVFAMGGGALGYWAGEKVGGIVFDWSADTVFNELPETSISFEEFTRLLGD
jgi:hypothetical protein